MVDGLAEFVREFPAWCESGQPMSWQHYVYGMRHLSRAGAREKLRMADAFAASQPQKPEQARAWLRTNRIIGGLE